MFLLLHYRCAVIKKIPLTDLTPPHLLCLSQTSTWYFLPVSNEHLVFGACLKRARGILCLSQTSTWYVVPVSNEHLVFCACLKRAPGILCLSQTRTWYFVPVSNEHLLCCACLKRAPGFSTQYFTVMFFFYAQLFEGRGGCFVNFVELLTITV